MSEVDVEIVARVERRRRWWTIEEKAREDPYNTREAGCYGVLRGAIGSPMVDPVTEARKRQIARPGGARPPSARKAMALARSKAYQDGADAEATLRAYATDVTNFEAWCAKHGFTAMPATPETVGAYLAAAGEGYAMPTLRRRVAAIARACGVAGHPLDTKHPAIRETLRGIGRKHGSPARRAAALTMTEVRKLCRACGTGIAGARDRALFLLGFAGALRRSEPIGLNVEHVTWTEDGLKLLIERSKTDKQGEGVEIAIPCGVRDDGLPQRGAGRGDHGTHPAPQPDHDAQLRPAGEAQPSQPGREARVVAGPLWSCGRFTAARLPGYRRPERGGPRFPVQQCRRRRRDLLPRPAVHRTCVPAAAAARRPHP
jgi:integrase